MAATTQDLEGINEDSGCWKDSLRAHDTTPRRLLFNKDKDFRAQFTFRPENWPFHDEALSLPCGLHGFRARHLWLRRSRMGIFITGMESSKVCKCIELQHKQMHHQGTCAG